MNATTLEKMSTMRLLGMKRAFTSSRESASIAYTPDELVAYLIEAEWTTDIIAESNDLPEPHTLDTKPI